MINKFVSILILAFILIIYEASAQRWQYMRHEVYFALGASNFLGELGGADQIGTNFVKDLEFSMTRPTLAGGYKYRFSDMVSVKTSLFYGRLNGDDQLTKEQYRQNRNLHFRSPLIELSTQLEYYFLKEKFDSYRLRLNESKINNLNAYIFAGVGGIYFNPKAKFEGEWHALQPLGTEGQGLKPGTKKYSRISVAVPMGIGVRYTLDKQWSVGVEYGVRKTFTDYIDDVSTEYYDNDAIRAANGDIAAELADPNLGLIKAFQDGTYYYDPTGPGMQRGDPLDKDSYMFGLISLHYRFLKGQRNIPKF